MKPDLVTDGEFKGWVTWAGEAFEHDAAGPFYFRTDAKGVVAAFRAKAKHMNQGGVVHGGCLMTFADFSLFAFAAKELEKAVMVSRWLSRVNFFQAPKRVSFWKHAETFCARAARSYLCAASSQLMARLVSIIRRH